MLIDKLFKGQRRPVELALDLTTDSVSLFERQPDESWTRVGKATLGASDFKKQIDALRVEALVRDRERSPMRLWLPPEQVLHRKFDLLERSAGPAKAEALRLLEKEGTYSTDELKVALAPAAAGEKRTVLAVLAQTVHEAMDYAAKWGFQPGAVSTRAYTEKFADQEPIFHGADSLTRKAGRAAMHSVMAVVALGLVGLAGMGVYHMAAPVVDPPDTVNSTVSLEPPTVTVQSGDFGSTVPFAVTQFGLAQSVAIGGVGLAGGSPEIEPEMQVYAEPRLAPPIPEIAAPSLAALLQVGPISARPNWSRPSRLNRDIPTNERIVVAARTEIDPDPSGADPNTETPSSGDQTGADQTASLNAGAAQTPVARENTGAETSETSTPTSGDQAETANANPQTAPLDPSQTVEAASTEEGEDAPTDRAPKEMASAPAPRPAGIAPADEENTDQTAEVVAEAPVARPRPNNTQDGETPAPATPDQATASQATSGEATPGRATPGQATASLVPLGATPVEEAPEQTADPDEPTALAALAAPKPVTRPLNLYKLTPSFNERPSASPKDNAPRSVRAAARERGISLSKTSLIGVIDAKSGRQALVRLPSGEFRKVGRGDVLEGWRVNTIGRETMKLTKRGQNRTLLLISR